MMRRLLLCLLCLPLLAFAQNVPPPNIAARSWVLLDFQSMQFLGAQNADERMEPASLTKLMSAYLVFQALDKKQIKPDQIAPVSVKAWKAGGSRMFIEPNRPVSVD